LEDSFPIVAGIAFGIILVKSEVISWFRIQEMFRLQSFHIYGGLLFGCGWAFTGACPGPMFAQIGTGALVVIVALLSAIALITHAKFLLP